MNQAQMIADSVDHGIREATGRATYEPVVAVGFAAELWSPDRSAMWFLDCVLLTRGGSIEGIRFGEGWRRICDMCRVPDAFAEGWLSGEIARQAVERGAL